MRILSRQDIGIGGLACAWLLAGCGGGGGAPASTAPAPGHQSAVVETVTPPAPLTQAASCSYPAVQAAVAAARPGDTVTIPAGDCDWTDRQLNVKAGIAIKGAGRDLTTLRRTAAMTGNNYLVSYDCREGGKVAFSDITLVGADIPTSEDRGLGLIDGCADFTITRSRFTRFVFAGVEVRGGVAQRGVIFGNQFIGNYNATLHNLGYGVVVFGDGTWPSLELGSANAVFVEDNYMIGNRHHIASNNGARYVFRHNMAIATDLTKEFAQVDAHGVTGPPRGTRSWEVYDNQFTAQITTGSNSAIGMRGGDGVIANNSYGPGITRPVQLLIEFGSCDQAYPVPDQIRAAYIFEPNVANPVTNQCPQNLVQDRDYAVGALPAGYVPYTYPHPLRAGAL